MGAGVDGNAARVCAVFTQKFTVTTDIRNIALLARGKREASLLSIDLSLSEET
jgi:hypothetical protein